MCIHLCKEAYDDITGQLLPSLFWVHMDLSVHAQWVVRPCLKTPKDARELYITAVFVLIVMNKTLSCAVRIILLSLSYFPMIILRTMQK